MMVNYNKAVSPKKGQLQQLKTPDCKEKSELL